MNREELIQQLDGIVTKKPKSDWSKYQRNIIDEVIKTLKQEHEIVTCKDCKHRIVESCCLKYKVLPYDSFYCKDGERNTK